MRITALVENTSDGITKAVHGLSFYIETEKHKILFDVGPNDTIFENAKRLNISLETVDTVIISHGHTDHGGALKHFLLMNKTAKIYVQRSAYEAHYTKALFLKIFVGLDRDTMNHPNVVLLDGDYTIDDELSLFTSKVESNIRSEANKALYTKDGLDDFRHEQDLLIHENEDVLIMGCGHCGVTSILESAPVRPSRCFGGFHVYNPVSRKTVSKSQLDELAAALEEYKDIRFYTCHCTGNKAYGYLNRKNDNISYFSCGNQVTV